MGRREALATAKAALLLALVGAAPSLGEQPPAAEGPAAAASTLLRLLLPSTPPVAGAAPGEPQAGGSAAGPPPLLDQLPLNATELQRQLNAGNGRLPVVFIPPLGGVQLQMRLDGCAPGMEGYFQKRLSSWLGLVDAALPPPLPAPCRAEGPHWWCPRSSHGAWRLAWLNPLSLLPGAFDCWAAAFQCACLRSRCPGPSIRGQRLWHCLPARARCSHPRIASSAWGMYLHACAPMQGGLPARAVPQRTGGGHPPQARV